MEDHELLLRHAERWASGRGRALDRDLLDDVLSLRSMHDGEAANRWPAHSAEQLMLVRWPAHGPHGCPDVPALVDTLDTFWGFLRATGRMASGSAEPKDLRREAKAAAKRMPAACADPAKFSSGKSLTAFGQEIGITMDDLPDLDEANIRLQQIVEAWNALPDEERHRRTDAGYAGSRLGGTFTDEAGPWTGGPPRGWSPPGTPRLDDEYGDEFLEEDEELRPNDPSVSAPFVRGSGFFRRVAALVEWVGDGREVTKIGVLRPAVARQAYDDLGLWDWERDWVKASGVNAPADPEADRRQAVLYREFWTTALNCVPLQRLWGPAVMSGAIAVRSTRAVRNAEARVNPTDDLSLVHYALVSVVGLLTSVIDHPYADPLLGVLLTISDRDGEPSSPDDLRQWWWEAPVNIASSFGIDPASQRRWSDITLDQCLAMFDDCGLWVRRHGYLVGTPFGWDVALTIIAAQASGLLPGPDADEYDPYEDDD